MIRPMPVARARVVMPESAGRGAVLAGVVRRFSGGAWARSRGVNARQAASAAAGRRCR